METKLRLARHWFYPVVFGTRTLWFVLGIRYLTTHADEWANGRNVFGIQADLAWVLPCYALAYLMPALLYLRRGIRPIYAALAEIGWNGAFFCLFDAGSEGRFDFYNFPTLMLGLMTTGRAATIASVASIVAVPVWSGLYWGLEPEAVVGMSIELGVLYGGGRCGRTLIASQRQTAELCERIAEQNRVLEVYARQIESLALNEERNRLARELHDTVGHTLTAAVAGMDAVYGLIDIAPGDAKSLLKELLRATRSGFDEARSHIHRIAPESDPEERSLFLAFDKIASEFGLHTGTDISVSVAGAEYPVPELVRTTMIRCLQESLANAKRHGRASSIRVELAYCTDSVRMTVEDNGRGAGELAEGFGLRAMSERIANLNGRLELSQESGKGLAVLCAIPTAGGRERVH